MREAIDGEREDEKQGEVVEAAMVCPRSTPFAEEGGAIDDNNNKNTHEGTPRTAPRVVRTAG